MSEHEGKTPVRGPRPTPPKSRSIPIKRSDKPLVGNATTTQP